MIKLPKKIAKTIQREFSSDYTVIKRIYIQSMFKELCVDLVEFRIDQEKSTNILRYFGDNTYSFICGYNTPNEVLEEMTFQVNNLY